MRIFIRILGIFLLFTLLASCAKIDRLHITINDQFSSTLQLVMTESNEDYGKSVKAGTTPDLDTLKKQAMECNFLVENYYLKNNYQGFKATKKFETKSDLELALSCMRVGQQVTLRPIILNKNFHENEYEFEIVINELFLENKQPSLFIITMPGEIEDSSSSAKGKPENSHLNIVNKKEGKDTVIWEISRLNTVDISFNNNQEIKSPIILKTKSKKSNFDLPVLISFLTLVIGGGGVFSLLSFLGSRKKA